MSARFALGIAAVSLALAGCSKKADEPQAEATVSSSDAAAAPAPSIAATEVAPIVSPSPMASETSEPPAVASTIPAAMHGRWGLVPKDCTSTAGDAKGLLVVSAKQMKFYESVARLAKVKSSGEETIRATFGYSGEGQSWTQDVDLNLTAGGKTLVRQDHGPDALPGPLTYTRCS